MYTRWNKSSDQAEATTDNEATAEKSSPTQQIPYHNADDFRRRLNNPETN